ncbi:hypothetical protein KGG85_gp48 [Streptomyces phage Tefunt]|uniref:Uncharacterized protein n=1 Tax=Streptomyces phage Tefunt TaxID=2041209 RepID=A0A291LHZ3_9CAUD|nr:hypothetical protein KGG85_gp48 [Streptomyces phage Tefunt]ATI18988.1 hypothetical protein SEA_TEFUNT_48 [Streptomyces phage Tefunt]
MSEEAPEQPIESEPEPVVEPEPETPVVEPNPVTEPTPEPPPAVEPPAAMQDYNKEFWDDERLLYFWRDAGQDGAVYSRPYNEEELAGIAKRQALDGLRVQAEAAIPYLDERIDASLTYLANPAPTAEQTATQIKVLADLAAYSAGTLKRVIVVLGELTGRPV